MKGHCMVRGFPYATHPTGWFVVELSDLLKPGEVKPMRKFSQDLVMYRGESGKVHVFDAHCKHNGAHLGYGGKVWGDDIVCPFHAWRWDCDGNNVDIPYSRVLHNKAKLKKWHAWEESGVIQLWHDAEGVEPYWEPILLPNPDFYYPLTQTHALLKNKAMYPQFFIENIADPAHIKYVHMAGYIPDAREYRWNGPNWGPFCDEPRMKTGTQGMSMIANRGHPTQPNLGDYDWSEQVNVVANSPVDDCVNDVWLITYVCKEEGYPGPELGPRAAKALRWREKNVQLDFALFDHCIYLDGPPWPPEESKGWIDVRYWARQFYPVDTGIRSIPPGGGKRPEFTRQEDSIVGGKHGRGALKPFMGQRESSIASKIYSAAE
jgi:phenylpropionate dioxygenase-like ring-hydroxylating dioxygenase large terminal subunit